MYECMYDEIIIVKKYCPPLYLRCGYENCCWGKERIGWSRNGRWVFIYIFFHDEFEHECQELYQWISFYLTAFLVKTDIPNHTTKSLRTHEDFLSELVFLKRFKLFFCSNVPQPRPGKRLYYMCWSGNFAQEILLTFLEQSFPRIRKSSPYYFSATCNCFYLLQLYYESNRDRIAEQSPMEVLGVQN